MFLQISLFYFISTVKKIYKNKNERIVQTVMISKQKKGWKRQSFYMKLQLSFFPIKSWSIYMYTVGACYRKSFFSFTTT